MLYTLGATTEQDLTPMYYTTGISQLPENIKGLSRRDFVIARKEEANQHGEGVKAKHPLSLPPQAQAEARS